MNRRMFLAVSSLLGATGISANNLRISNHAGPAVPAVSTSLEEWRLRYRMTHGESLEGKSIKDDTFPPGDTRRYY